MIDYVRLDHRRFVRAQRDIFIKSIAPDCMRHRCRLVDEHDRVKLDACCQYGVDVDVGERDAILDHRAEIAALLLPDAAGQPWFEQDEVIDTDFPSGRFVRTRTHGDGCIFLAHDRRGCAIHRAAHEGGWDIHRVKPDVCRLFPLTYEADAIVLSDDYTAYSCAFDPDAPSLYRVSRDALEQIFGAELVAAMDRAEAEVLGPGVRLRVVAS